MNIEVADACNVHCSSCLSPHGKNFMSIKDFAVILSKIPRHEKKIVALHWRGEPTLHRNLPEIAEICKKNGVKPWISTNTSTPLLGDRKYVAQLLSNLWRIETCIDGHNQETLSQYRKGASWNQVLRNLSVLGFTKSDCRRDMRVLMFKYNEKHEKFFIMIAKKNNFDRLCFANPIINYKTVLNDKEADVWLASKEQYQRYKKTDDEWSLKRLDTCIPHFCVSVHGSVHPCGHDWKLEYNLGNLLTDKWETIQKNMDKLKPKMMKRDLSICEKWCCLSDEKVSTWMNL